jgi:cyclophilin family peptidyl-prolyl cis-trans isomerase
MAINRSIAQAGQSFALLVCVLSIAPSSSQARAEPAVAMAGQPGDAAAQAKAAFDQAFRNYKEVVTQIEKLRIDYQTANAATRNKINGQLSGHVAHAQSLVAAMVDAAMEAYRLAPNENPDVTDLLVTVAKHCVVGQQIGPAENLPGGDEYVPIDGGDQYERALPIIKRLLEGNAKKNELYVWGFLSAFVTNDYDLAEQYLKNANESGAIAALQESAQNAQDQQSGANQFLLRTVTNYASAVERYRQLWAKESALRAAEAATDDLPRVRFTTTKGVITLELFENEAPQSVANMISLVKQGFYDGSPFHRVLPKFMAQGGAKTDDGGGGPEYTIRGEHKLPVARHHFRGTLSMARKANQPDSGSSQFFLTFVPTTHLDGEHTAFGRVIEGMEVLGDLQRRVPQQANPAKPDRILKAEMLRDRGHEYKFERLPE